jgi:hypothetical protein
LLRNIGCRIELVPRISLKTGRGTHTGAGL